MPAGVYPSCLGGLVLPGSCRKNRVARPNGKAMLADPSWWEPGSGIPPTASWEPLYLLLPGDRDIFITGFWTQSLSPKVCGVERLKAVGAILLSKPESSETRRLAATLSSEHSSLAPPLFLASGYCWTRQSFREPVGSGICVLGLGLVGTCFQSQVSSWSSELRPELGA